MGWSEGGLIRALIAGRMVSFADPCHPGSRTLTPKPEVLWFRQCKALYGPVGG